MQERVYTFTFHSTMSIANHNEYTQYRWKSCANGTHRMFDKDKNADLKKLCMKVAKAVAARRIEKFNISKTGSGAAEEAKSGIFAKNRKKKAAPKSGNHWDAAYDLHSKTQDAKDDFAAKRLVQGDEQLKVMQGIERSIGMMSWSDADFFAAFTEYVIMEYPDEDHQDSIVDMAENHKSECVRFWRMAVRYPDTYSTDIKNKRIKKLYNKWRERQ